MVGGEEEGEGEGEVRTMHNTTMPSLSATRHERYSTAP